MLAAVRGEERRPNVCSKEGGDRESFWPETGLLAGLPTTSSKYRQSSLKITPAVRAYHL